MFIHFSDPSEVEVVEASRARFSFDSFKIRFYKLRTINMLPEKEDNASLDQYKAFGAHHEHMNPNFTNCQ